jgi:hypothetical protein
VKEGGGEQEWPADSFPWHRSNGHSTAPCGLEALCLLSITWGWWRGKRGLGIETKARAHCIQDIVKTQPVKLGFSEILLKK